MRDIEDEIVKALVSSIKEEIDREILEALTSSMSKSLTINNSGNIFPQGYSKRELEEMMAWLTEHSGVDGWAFTGRVFHIRDPKVKIMFILRWS